jgi:hypothetical protein
MLGCRIVYMVIGLTYIELVEDGGWEISRTRLERI